MRLRWFLSMTAILAVVVGATVFLDARLSSDDDKDQAGAGGTVAPGTGDSTTTTTSASTVPAGDQVTVTGTVTALHLGGAVLDPREVPTPLSIVCERGFGNGGEITGAIVDGTAASIVWDCGRPFVLSSGGALVLDPVRVDLAPEGLRFALADAVHAFTPGTYQLATPVAVGTTGVAGAREAVTFTADADSDFTPTGDAALFLGPSSPRHLTGPGAVHLEGTLEVVDDSGTRAVATIDLVDGPYDVTLTPTAGGGWTVSATLQGKTTTT